MTEQDILEKEKTILPTEEEIKKIINTIIRYNIRP